MKLIDVHTHLQSSAFDFDREGVLERARQSGVVRILNAATEPSDWEKVKALSDNPLCAHALGIHPWYIPDNAEQFLKQLPHNVFNGASAIGEIGLDLKFSKIPIERQIPVFETLMGIARDLSLPAVIHCIGAFGELIQTLKKIPQPQGCMIHSFNGSPELAKDLMRHNVFFSLGGILTYRDSRKRAEMLRAIESHFMLETDSPDIPPAEKKGIRNEPSFIRYNLAAAAEILNIPEEVLADRTYYCAQRLFNL